MTRFAARYGPWSVITGASDDDPSGIATYSQTGAQFGYGMSWVMLFSYPLMIVIQEICARIGRCLHRAWRRVRGHPGRPAFSTANWTSWRSRTPMKTRSMST